MRSCLAILVTVIACVACKDPGLERLRAVKSEVCACKTASCADQAIARLDKANFASNTRTQTAAREIMDCRAKVEAAERPTTDPDAEGSGEPAAPAEGSAAPAAPAPAAGSASH